MNQARLNTKQLSYYLPITIRGISLLILSIYFLAGPVRLNSDIIAAGFAFCTLAVITLFVSLALLSRHKLKKSLAITLSMNSSEDKTQIADSLFAGQAIQLLAKVSGIQISPFYELRMRYRFEQQGVQTATHSLDSSTSFEKYISESINFPHRGNWLLKGASLTLVDRLGLTKTALPFVELNQILTIEPSRFHCPRWPVLASTIRVDDQVNHPVERKGDLYDLKQYHPSDGARKIVWKLFAKSGQLFSRYPEPAFSPEGKVAMLCLAKKLDDKLASETIAYIQELEKLDIEILFASLSKNQRIATNSETALRLLIEDVWDSELSDNDDAIKSLSNLISSAQGQNNERSVQTIVLAISEDSLEKAEYRSLVLKCQQTLINSGIRCSVFISSTLAIASKEQTAKHFLSFKRINKLLIEEPETYQKYLPNKSKEFIASINSSYSDLAWS